VHKAPEPHAHLPSPERHVHVHVPPLERHRAYRIHAAAAVAARTTAQGAALRHARRQARQVSRPRAALRRRDRPAQHGRLGRRLRGRHPHLALDEA